jgi:hypothetical protein
LRSQTSGDQEAKHKKEALKNVLPNASHICVNFNDKSFLSSKLWMKRNKTWGLKRLPETMLKHRADRVAIPFARSIFSREALFKLSRLHS